MNIDQSEVNAGKISRLIAAQASASAAHSWHGRLGGRVFSINAPSPEFLRYLDEFSSDIGDRETAHYRIHVIEDEQLLRSIIRYSREIPRQRLTMYPGQSVVLMDLDQAYLTLSDDQQCVYLRNGSAVVCVVSSRCSEPSKLTIRIARELLLGEAPDSWLHSAAMASPEGDGWLILGQSGAGKTTLAILCHELLGYDLIGNDYVILRGKSVSALPLKYRIGLGTVAASAKLSAVREGLGPTSPGGGPPDTDASKEASEFASSHKIEMTPRQLGNTLDARLTDSVSLHRVVVPKITSTVRTVKVDQVSAVELDEVLENEVRPIGSSMWPDRWLGAGSQVSGRSTAEMKRSIRSVPVTKVLLPTGPVDASALRRALESIGQ